MDACSRASNSAAGLDGWEPQDLKLLPIEAYARLTDMLNAIEEGAAWPTGVLSGRIFYLAKDPDQIEEPKAYRPILILPSLYRRWASYRLGSMDSWIGTWATSAMIAGIPQRGAEDAWWLSSIQMESWHTQNVAFSGSSADIAKCFDQIVRPLLYTMAYLAGMPSRVLKPYMRFMEALTVYNTIGRSGLGGTIREEVQDSTGLSTVHDADSTHASPMDHRHRDHWRNSPNSG